jgi:hypothetical protein
MGCALACFPGRKANPSSLPIFPILGGKHDRPEFRRWEFKLEGYGEVVRARLIDADHMAAFLHPGLRVHQNDWLTGEEIHLMGPPCALTTSVCVFSCIWTRSRVSATTVMGICSITRLLRRRLPGSAAGTRLSVKGLRWLRVLGRKSGFGHLQSPKTPVRRQRGRAGTLGTRRTTTRCLFISLPKTSAANLPGVTLDVDW